MSSLINRVLFIVLGILLLLSLGGNVLLYIKAKKQPVYDIAFQRDTIVQLDTVNHQIVGQTLVENPKPVEIDTVKQTETYRDTVYLPFGWISSIDLVRGSGNLLSSGLNWNLNIPTYYETRIITNRETRTVRNNLLFAQVGMGYDFGGNMVPQGGFTYIWNRHRWKLSVDYSLDKRINATIGYSLLR